jgi:thiamine-phosphate pyrophosphorylase
MTQALGAGARLFQYRNKSGPRRLIFETTLMLVRLARQAGAQFLVNDHADIAAAADADGVHLGQDDLPIEYARKLLGKGKLIGISTHSLDQAREAEAAGADYIGFGPLFPTATKDAGQAQGIHNLTVIKKSVRLPVIAIGGIDHTRVQEVMRSGADGVAILSAILASENIALSAEKIISLIAEVR